MTGTVIAQLIAYLIYPVLTRIYSTADMGELGVYTRLVAFIAAFATARYEATLPVAKQDNHAFSLYRLSFRISLIVLTAVFLIGLTYYMLKPYSFSNYVFLVISVLSAYVSVWINLGTNWSVRKKLFRQISIQRMVNSVSVNTLRLIFGLLNWGAFGLIFGTLLGSFLSVFSFVRTFLSNKKGDTSSSDLKRMRVLAKNYKSYPTVYLPHVLLDLGVDLALAAFIVEFYGKGTFGSYSYAYLMLRLPLSLFGQSLGQVFFNKSSELFNKKQAVYPLTLKTLRTLFYISIIPFTVLFFFGSDLFGFVFGEKWREAGRIAEILAPALMLNFIVSPISSLSLVLSKQKLMFGFGVMVAIFQLFNFGVLPILLKAMGKLHITGVGFDSFHWILGFNSLLLSIIYLIIIVLFLKLTKRSKT
jgi:O-antigen/teichoic acid export membrane protein